jgi:cytochrome c553
MTRMTILIVLAMLGSSAIAGGSAEHGADKAKQVCAPCHGADGDTPLQAEYPRIAGQSQDYLYKALRDYRSGARKNAIMGAQAANLSGQDMQDLAAHFSGLKGSLAVIR